MRVHTTIVQWKSNKYYVFSVCVCGIRHPALAFICPCIASVSLKYNQPDATFSRSIYFYKLIYIFQAVPPPIIRSTKLYIQPAAAGSSIGLTIPDVVCSFVLLMMGGGTA